MRHSSFSRRDILMGTAGVAAVSIVGTFAWLRRRRMGANAGDAANVIGPYGLLQPVADLETGLPLLLLPDGFEYRSHSWSGDLMTNGQPAPDLHDGMGVIFAERRGAELELVLVRNHERAHASPIAALGRYDTAVPAGEADPPGGGTTNLVFSGRQLVSVEPSLGGTLINCAGGVTPWGSWLSCEETMSDLSAAGGRRHGYVFEVQRDVAQTTGKPIVDMGRMLHEAVAVDPDTRYAYLTEDNPNRCTFYRFIPNDRGGTVGSYEAGGRLQAARVAGRDNADLRMPASGDEHRLEWIDIEEPDADPAQLPAGFPGASGMASGPFLEAWASGALCMSRGEGISFHAGKFYVVDTTAGTAWDGRGGWGEGAVWEYDPRAETLRAIFVAGTQLVGDNPDNITISPRGGILLCEDGEPATDRYGPGTRLLGLTAEADSYTFAKNNVQLSQDQILAAGKAVLPGDYRGGELAGACFDPAGEVLFVNIQQPGITFAIRGPWTKGNL